ncbi:pilus assembly protein PilM [Catenovulum adriaticum]|uniref:Pilus assembly protein PilM n=1 Tax=Catenovulum adriaticum TaxID=2984846 RepID=A0ABY7AL47_9ALTE|nr:pilus assembly protein PilM [Catenovulum sp. TS8]WAJ70259.1 pilus assembly protein PilM [Catenovulum sp. TS8]
MFEELLGKKNTILIGIDIGSYSVKAVLMERHGSQYKLLQCARELMPKGIMNDKEIQDIEAVGKVIQRLRKRLPKQYKQVSVAVSGSTVITKTIFMDASFNDDELATQIEIEADSLIPYPIEEVNLDFERLGINQADKSKVNVLLSAARTESVEARVSAIELGGLTAKVMDVESYALARAAKLCMHQLPSDANKKLVAVVDIGAHMTLMSVIRGEDVIYTRDQSFGGDMYTKNIVNYYNKSYEEAELAKLTADLPPSYTFEVLAPFQTAIIQQIRRAIQMFTTSTSEDKVDYLLLSGGTALVEGLAEVITEELGIHCVIASPFMQMNQGETLTAENNQHNSEYLIASGLAMRSFNSCHI